MQQTQLQDASSNVAAELQHPTPNQIAPLQQLIDSSEGGATQTFDSSEPQQSMLVQPAPLQTLEQHSQPIADALLQHNSQQLQQLSEQLPQPPAEQQLQQVPLQVTPPKSNISSILQPASESLSMDNFSFGRIMNGAGFANREMLQLPMISVGSSNNSSTFGKFEIVQQLISSESLPALRTPPGAFSSQFSTPNFSLQSLDLPPSTFVASSGLVVPSFLQSSTQNAVRAGSFSVRKSQSAAPYSSQPHMQDDKNNLNCSIPLPDLVPFKHLKPPGSKLLCKTYDADLIAGNRITGCRDDAIWQHSCTEYTFSGVQVRIAFCIVTFSSMCTGTLLSIRALQANKR